MTIVAAAIGPDGVWIGSDGRAEGNGTVVALNAVKWTYSPDGRWAVSHSGEHAYCEASRAAFFGFTGWADLADDDSGAREVLRVLRDGLLALPGGPKPVTDNAGPFPDWRWSPIIASPDRLWRADSTLWAFMPPSTGGPYFAGGSGMDAGLGAMHALRSAGERSARALVNVAVAAACTFDPGCGGERWMRRMGPSVAGVVAA